MSEVQWTEVSAAATAVTAVISLVALLAVAWQSFLTRSGVDVSQAVLLAGDRGRLDDRAPEVSVRLEEPTWPLLAWSHVGMPCNPWRGDHNWHFPEREGERTVFQAAVVLENLSNRAVEARFEGDFAVAAEDNRVLRAPSPIVVPARGAAGAAGEVRVFLQANFTAKELSENYEAREQGQPLPCGQVDIDAWFAENTEHARTRLRAFLNWAIQGRHCQRSLSIPAMKISRRPALGEDERLDALGRLLTDTEIPMRLRVAGVIVLLYAQPLSRIVRLTIDDVIRDGDAVLLRLGEPASPVPTPVAALLLEHITNRSDMNTATNPASRWLFPGRRTGQPLGSNHLSALLNKAGIPIAAARGAAIRQQLLELPAPVVADALGYHDKTTSRLIRETGGTWSRYAPGDHARSTAGWVPRETGDS